MWEIGVVWDSEFGRDWSEDAKVSVQEAEQYLTLALKSYLAVLCQGNGSRSQAAVYRLVALWFANADSISVLKSIPPTLPRV